jgi:hypothetical protein
MRAAVLFLIFLGLVAGIGWVVVADAKGSGSGTTPPLLAVTAAATPEEQAIRTILSDEWPTAATIKLQAMQQLWAQGQARLWHITFDAQNLNGALVRERRLVAFEMLGGREFSYSKSKWATPTSATPTPDEIRRALVSNGFPTDAMPAATPLGNH